MFSNRRYQRVAQNGDSESDSDEMTLFTSGHGENGSAQKGEWHFGVRAYDLSQDLDLPQVRVGRHSSKREQMRGYSRKRALFGACIFIVIVGIVTALAVLFVMNNQYTAIVSQTTTTTTAVPPSTTEADESSTDELTTECPKAPKPLVKFGSDGRPLGHAPPPSQRPCKTTRPPNTPTTQPVASSTSKAVPSDKVEHEHLGVTTHPPLVKTEVPFTETKGNFPLEGTTEVLPTTSKEEAVGVETMTNKGQSRVTSEADEFTTTLQPETTTGNQGGAMESTTAESAEESLTTPTVNEKMTTSSTTPSSKDDQLLNNWSDIIFSDTTQQTETVTVAMPSVTTDKLVELTSEPSVEVTLTFEPSGIDWEQDFFPAMSETTTELFDVNSDGVLDVLVIEDQNQCGVRVVALDGKTGTKFWQKELNFPAFAIRCELDVNGDGAKDCLVTGRGGGFAAIDRGDGSLLWEVDPTIVFPPYNFYFPLIVSDLNSDGVNDIINMHGGDMSYAPDEHKRSPAYLVVVSGKTGQSLMRPMLTPDGHESYMSPVLFKLNGKEDLVLFGSGGETVPGSLWAVSLSSIRTKVIKEQFSHKDEVYKPFINDTYHPCFMRNTDFNEVRPTFDHKAFDFQRPVFVTSSSSYMRFCPSWANVNPIWNIYDVCLYELVRSEVKGVLLPPVLVDLDLDSIDDLVVSTFDGHTIALNGSDASTRLWEVYYPNAESYSVPTPLYYNEDSIPDLLIRNNLGEWNHYNLSTIRLLDGRNGAEIWSFDSAHTGMMSTLSIASKSPGSDAMLFMTIGTPDTNTDPAYDTDQEARIRVHRRDNNLPKDADVGILDIVNGEAETYEDDHDQNEGPDGVNYDMDFMKQMKMNHDPPNLWVSTPEDQFPDPKFDVDGFIVYCGETYGRLTAYLWLITREMIERGAEIQPIAVHEPFLFTLPEVSPFTDSPDGFPPDHFDPNDAPPGGRNFSPDNGPPPVVDAGHFAKRHDETEDPDPVNDEVTKKDLRCSHISAPLQVISTPAVGDLDSDGRLDVVYSVVWSSAFTANVAAVPELKVFAFTLEERYTQLMGGEVKGQKLIDFESFLPAKEQPWSRYMGRYGNNVYRRGRAKQSDLT